MNHHLITVERVFHVGSMDAKDLGVNSPGGSHEGNCLSVSVCPNAWVEIARLGGSPLHEMTSSDAAFLDVRSLAEDPESLAEVMDWASDEGLVEVGSSWRCWSSDEEGVWSYMTLGSEDDAMSEARVDEDYETPEEVPGPDGKPGVERVDVFLATPELRKLTGMWIGPHEDATDAAAMAWAMTKAEDALGRPLDGIWWRERYDPAALSAPRGGVFPTMVSRWKATPASLNDVDDEESLAEFPETQVHDGTPSFGR